MKRQGWLMNEKVATLIIGAFSFVVAFAINSTAQAYFRENIGELDRSTAWFIYTFIALLVAIIVINLLWRYIY